MRLAIYQLDSFADEVFAGNPAAVVPLDAWLPDETMQAIARENNLSETAFFVPETAPETDGFHLRWFTPAVEVDLCGHATLAAARVILDRVQPRRTSVSFMTRSGRLVVERAHDHPTRLVMDFPSQPPESIRPPDGLADALGVTPIETLFNVDVVCVVERAEHVRALTPDIGALATVDARGIIVTAVADTPGIDFVSRFFAPRSGIAEDPVTGSAHCKLVPYWAARLGRTALTARQVSPRGGTLWCELRDQRVSIAGDTVYYLEGTITC